MANSESCKHRITSCENPFEDPSLSSISEKELCPKVNEQPELSWPASDERDLTQIQNDDPAPNASCGDVSAITTFKHCPEIRKVHQKVLGNTENDKVYEYPSHQLDRKFAEKKLKIELPSQNENIHGTDHWIRFSDEIILGIFSLLSKKNLAVCTQVCKRWHRLGYDDSLWYSMDLNGTSISECVLKSLLLRGIVVLRLAWAQVVPPEANKYQELISSESSSSDCHYNIHYLDASSCSVSENMLSDTISKSKKLKKLSLESCCLSAGSLRAIGNCPKMEVLNLCMCSNLTNAGVEVLANKCPSITELNLSWTNLTPQSVNQVVKSFPLLIKLNLSGCRETLQDEAVEELLKTCQHLKVLDVSDCTVITERCVKAIIQHNMIEDLSLSRCYGIAPKSLELLSALKSLQALQIFGFLTTTGIKSLEKRLPDVRMNQNMFSSIARPTETLYKGMIWRIRCTTQKS